MMITLRSVCAAALALTILAGAAEAQIIRPDSATATTQFSSGYVIANAINGTGLPANFSPADAHETYAFGNHWTTANGRTIGESATFNFNTPQTLGGFYMWQHRSNGVASNPYYAVVRFDLVLRDGGGAVLATFPNLTALPNIATAQTIPFAVTSGVRSVQFIVRETQNNNVSPYTGLAEVAFDDCIAVGASGPSDRFACPSGEATLDAGSSGSGPIQHQWQALADSGDWVDLSDGVLVLDGAATCATVTGARGPTAVIGFACTSGRERVNGRQFRCVVGNPCGSITTRAATLHVCAADFNCDGSVDFFDYLDFVAGLDSEDPRADFNGDETVDFFDYLDFAVAFDGGC
jgi:hypothetical protein